MSVRQFRPLAKAWSETKMETQSRPPSGAWPEAQTAVPARSLERAATGIPVGGSQRRTETIAGVTE